MGSQFREVARPPFRSMKGIARIFFYDLLLFKKVYAVSCTSEN